MTLPDPRERIAQLNRRNFAVMRVVEGLANGDPFRFVSPAEIAAGTGLTVEEAVGATVMLAGRGLLMFRTSEGAVTITPQGEQFVTEALKPAEVPGRAQPAPLAAPAMTPPVTREAFERVIEKFKDYIATDARAQFWTGEIVRRAYVWTPSPEALAQSLFETFLKGHFDDAIESLVEVTMGGGRADLYLMFRGGFKTIIEFKMCGGRSYSIGVALAGMDQLVQYLTNRSLPLGYLVVFDGRTNQIGKGMPPAGQYGGKEIVPVVVDVRPKLKPPEVESPEARRPPRATGRRWHSPHSPGTPPPGECGA